MVQSYATLLLTEYTKYFSNRKPPGIVAKSLFLLHSVPHHLLPYFDYKCCDDRKYYFFYLLILTVEHFSGNSSSVCVTNKRLNTTCKKICFFLQITALLHKSVFRRVFPFCRKLGDFFGRRSAEFCHDI